MMETRFMAIESKTAGSFPDNPYAHLYPDNQQENDEEESLSSNERFILQCEQGENDLKIFCC